MKHYIIYTLALLISITSNAQPNNPYNSTGEAFIQSYKLLSEDVKVGKIQDLSPETVNMYKEKLPMRTDISPTTAARIVKEVQNKKIDIFSGIRNSTVSTEAQKLYIQLFEAITQKNTAELPTFLIEHTNTVLLSKIPPIDRQTLLKLIAIHYQIVALQQMQLRSKDRCSVPIRGVTIEVSGSSCILVSVSHGFIVGMSECGMMCAVGGAILGFVTWTFS
jgi:hypothetical protein